MKVKELVSHLSMQRVISYALVLAWLAFSVVQLVLCRFWPSVGGWDSVTAIHLTIMLVIGPSYIAGSLCRRVPPVGLGLGLAIGLIVALFVCQGPPDPPVTIFIISSALVWSAFGIFHTRNRPVEQNPGPTKED